MAGEGAAVDGDGTIGAITIGGTSPGNVGTLPELVSTTAIIASPFLPPDGFHCC